MIKKIAVIGVGRMGGGIARNLCRGGFEVTVFDFNPAAVELCTKEGASAADGVGAAVAGQDLVITSLPLPETVTSVYQENLELSRPDAIWMDVSTIDPTTARQVSDAVQASGREFVACPLGKGPAQAESGTLPLFVGGKESVVEALVEVFACVGESTHYLGTVEGATGFKIVSNMIGMANLSALAEGYALCRALGVDDDGFVAALRNTGAWSAQADLRLPWMIAGDFENRFGVDLAVKDVRLALDAAARQGIAAQVGAAGLMNLVAASAHGFGGEDVDAVLRVVDPKRNGASGQ
ncbi:MAG: NAD(P)-dependent oxidoreductase [Ancrocorticia sp.]